jgi:hypothetical protein
MFHVVLPLVFMGRSLATISSVRETAVTGPACWHHETVKFAAIAAAMPARVRRACF